MPLSALSQAVVAIEPLARAFVVAGMNAAAIVGASPTPGYCKGLEATAAANGWAIERESGLGRDFINPSMGT
jgi:hypothetical protein